MYIYLGVMIHISVVNMYSIADIMCYKYVFGFQCLFVYT